jgi:hypothetical protein
MPPEGQVLGPKVVADFVGEAFDFVPSEVDVV